MGSLCTDDDLRLDTTVAPIGGRVEVCHDGVWGSVCNEMWSTIDAQVACNQLGLPSSGMYNLIAHYLNFSVKILIQRLPL